MSDQQENQALRQRVTELEHEIKEMRDLVAHYEERFRLHFVETSTLSMVIGNHGLVVDANPALLSLLGYTRDDLIGKPAFDFVAPHHRSLAQERVLLDFSAPVHQGMILDIIAANGDLRRFVFPKGIAPKVMRDGQPVAICYSAIDISDHDHRDLVPICSICKAIRDAAGRWHSVESYLHSQTGVEFTHGICPPCLESFCESHTTTDVKS